MKARITNQLAPKTKQKLKEEEITKKYCEAYEQMELINFIKEAWPDAKMNYYPKSARNVINHNDDLEEIDEE